MDASLHGSVLRRHWRVVLVGCVLAIVLAALALGRPTLRNGKPGFAYRQSEAWQSNSTILLTQSGFQEGRLRWQTDPGRFVNLTDVYANLVTSDAAMKHLKKGGPLDGSVNAQPFLTSTQGGTPLFGIYGSSTTPTEAVALTKRATASFSAYLAARQAAAGIPKGNRVDLSIVQDASPPILVKPRKKTLSLVVFIAMLSLTFGFVYVLENARQRREVTAPIEAVESPIEAVEALPTKPTTPTEVDVVEEPASARRWA